MRMRRSVVLLLVSAFSLAALAATVAPRRQQVYMFGCALSFNDSVVVMTDLQPVEAYMMPNGFLADRSLYSLQLNNYMVGQLQRENMTCAVFFDKKKARLEKKYQKIRKKYRTGSDFVLQMLGVDAFRFQTEEWVEPIVEESSPVSGSEDGKGVARPSAAEKKKDSE